MASIATSSVKETQRPIQAGPDHRPIRPFRYPPPSRLLKRNLDPSECLSKGPIIQQSSQRLSHPTSKTRSKAVRRKCPSAQRLSFPLLQGQDQRPSFISTRLRRKVYTLSHFETSNIVGLGSVVHSKNQKSFHNSRNLSPTLLVG
jgi:hypothetical protein